MRELGTRRVFTPFAFFIYKMSIYVSWLNILVQAMIVMINAKMMPPTYGFLVN